MKKQTSSDAIGWLKNEYCKRKSRNRHYSMRGFARDLGISSGTLADIFSTRRPISKRMGQKIVERCGLSPKEKIQFWSLLDSRELTADSRDKKQIEAEMITEDQLSIISDWYHFGILSLLKTNNFKYDVKWIASRLGISRVEAESAIERLLRVGLVKKSKRRLTRNKPKYRTTTNVPSEALKQSHRQSIEQSIDAIYSTPLEKRDITSSTVAVNLEKLGEAKELIEKFHADLQDLLETGSKSEVYNLNIQLIPITKGTNHA